MSRESKNFEISKCHDLIRSVIAVKNLKISNNHIIKNFFYTDLNCIDPKFFSNRKYIMRLF